MQGPIRRIAIGGLVALMAILFAMFQPLFLTPLHPPTQGVAIAASGLVPAAGVVAPIPQTATTPSERGSTPLFLVSTPLQTGSALIIATIALIALAAVTIHPASWRRRSRRLSRHILTFGFGGFRSLYPRLA